MSAPKLPAWTHSEPQSQSKHLSCNSFSLKLVKLTFSSCPCASGYSSCCWLNTCLSRKCWFIVSHTDIRWQCRPGFVGTNHHCQTNSESVCHVDYFKSLNPNFSATELWVQALDLPTFPNSTFSWPHHHLLNPFTPWFPHCETDGLVQNQRPTLF